MKPTQGTWHPVRRDELRDEFIHDAYQSTRKYAEPTRCPDCGLVFRDGRWQQGEAGAGAHAAACPACRRLHDDFPAGYVTLRGPYLAAHREEILRLVRNHEARARAEHPLQRIMGMFDAHGELQVTTTDAHLARGIGEALRKAYRGRMAFHYSKADNLLRVRWTR
jgi:hypothetical protein